jgi:hypothetical protein
MNSHGAPPAFFVVSRRKRAGENSRSLRNFARAATHVADCQHNAYTVPVDSCRRCPWHGDAGNCFAALRQWIGATVGRRREHGSWFDVAPHCERCDRGPSAARANENSAHSTKRIQLRQPADCLQRTASLSATILFEAVKVLKVPMAHTVALCICALPPVLCNTAPPNCLQHGKSIDPHGRSARPTGLDHLAFK